MKITKPRVTLPLLIHLPDDSYVLIEDHAYISGNEDKGIWVSHLVDGESDISLGVWSGDEAYQKLQQLKEE